MGCEHRAYPYDAPPGAALFYFMKRAVKVNPIINDRISERDYSGIDDILWCYNKNIAP